MKDILNLIFLIFLAVSPFVVVSAYYYSDLTPQTNQQVLLNALNKQTEAINNATYQAQQTAQRNAQSAQFRSLPASSWCDSQYREPKSSYRSQMSKMDMGNPLVAQQADNYMNYLNESYLQCLRWSQEFDQSCKDDLGIYGKLGTVDTISRKYNCACQTGYQISNNNCVPIVNNNPPVKTNDQKCQEWVENTKFIKINDSNGNMVCDCKIGYEWNDDGSACVIVPETVKTSVSGCTSTVGFSPTTGKSCSGLVASVTSVQSAQSSTTGVKFSRNLTVGSRGADVTALQQILISGGFLDGDATGYFGQMTKVAVIKFQNEHAAEVLAPAGLTIGTGFVGVTTRMMLNTMGGSI